MADQRFVERFNGTVLKEFFRPIMHAKLFASVEALQAELDVWLNHYNHERPHLGYRVGDHGRRSNDLSDKEAKRTFYD